MKQAFGFLVRSLTITHGQRKTHTSLFSSLFTNDDDDDEDGGKSLVVLTGTVVTWKKRKVLA